ncbi:MAG: hypothetical protein RMY36_032370 [Nostoc sp. SerVER01]|nr:hypothetical protein [Nostoc sp. SerVER01]
MLARRSSFVPKHPIVELEEFLSYWEVNHTELTQICEAVGILAVSVDSELPNPEGECNISTVQKWFLDKENADYCPPTQHHKQLLAQAHYLWRSQANKQRTERLRQMYWLHHSEKGGLDG